MGQGADKCYSSQEMLRNGCSNVVPGRQAQGGRGAGLLLDGEALLEAFQIT